jgi:pyruvate kinase
MLESMISHPLPTRAETSDVANAVWDGTDVVMLSGETSVGKYPLETVKMMNKILIKTEEHMDYMKRYRFEMPATHEENLLESVCKALSSMAKQLNAGAIVTITHKGRMASTISRFRPGIPIIVLSDNFEVMNRFRLVWGVNPIYFDDIKSEDDFIRQGMQVIRERKLVNEGDTILFTSGAPDDEKGSDIWIRFVKA